MSLTAVEFDDHGVATVTMANPPRGYLNRDQVAELDRVMDELETDDQARVIVFTGGVPGVFIRHYDVREILEAAEAVRASGLDGEALMARGADGNPISALLERIDRCPKPTIAAINGYAQGGGFEFALCCDIRVSEPGAFRIGLPETNIGIFPGAGGTERLARLIGEGAALNLILRGLTLTPADALEAGLVHELAPNGALHRAREIAAEIARKPAGGVRAAKALVKRTGDRPLDLALAEGRGRFSRLLLEDDEAIEAMQTFLATGEDINA